MKTGWFKVGPHWYYAYGSGALAVNTTTPDGYRVNGNGEWVNQAEDSKSQVKYSSYLAKRMNDKKEVDGKHWPLFVRIEASSCLA